MGNIVDAVTSHKVETLLFGFIGAAGYLLYKTNKEKDQLRALLRKSLESKNEGIKEF